MSLIFRIYDSYKNKWLCQVPSLRLLGCRCNIQLLPSKRLKLTTQNRILELWQKISFNLFTHRTINQPWGYLLFGNMIKISYLIHNYQVLFLQHLYLFIISWLQINLYSNHSVFMKVFYSISYSRILIFAITLIAFVDSVKWENVGRKRKLNLS